MRKARFTEHQIITVIKSVEAGRTVKDVCREAGISEATYYNWSPDTAAWNLLILKR
ncbi:transposase family protein [Salmonella enterica subsp. enterica]|uniref:Transposase family protein n=1 Tax=Salmonella enterica I TaxID=59201 RepID=A0A379WUP5_SALET|nr:transposase family protein [Salmonella enterica subsp. enterica]